MCSASQPAAPDYKGAAESTAQSQRVNQYTPYGSLVYSPVGGQQTQQPAPQQAPQAQPTPQPQAPSGGIIPGYNEDSVPNVPSPQSQFTNQPAPSAPPPQQWQSEMTLNPEAQKALDSQMRVSAGLGAATEGQLGAVQERFSTPMSLQSVQDVADKSYSAQTARLDPAWQQRESMERTRLANQGLSSGGEAYGNAMRDFGQQRNDAYQQANLAAIQTMPQTYQLESAAYNQPLNALNALRTGAQVNNPQFGGLGQPTDYSKAAGQQSQYDQGVYGAEQSAANSNNAALAMIAAKMMASGSDRRLKTDIVAIGKYGCGVTRYVFRFIGTDDWHEGAMADEVRKVMPEAVRVDRDGYLEVNYGVLQ